MLWQIGIGPLVLKYNVLALVNIVYYTILYYNSSVGQKVFLDQIT